MNFTLDEFTRSDTATRLGIDNTLPLDLHVNAAKTLAMLQRIRDYLSQLAGKDVPIRISSGYRCLALNRAIGSKDSSDHTQALAADWTAPAFGSPTDICRALAPQVSVLQIGQLINEFPKSGWVHTGVSLPAKSLNRVITITRAGTVVGITGA